MTEISAYAVDDAHARAQVIRHAIGSLATWQREVIRAYEQRDWVTLGYPGWSEYVEGEFGEVAGTLGPEQRVMVIGAMVEAKMSTRAIAAATGVNQSTVARTITAQVMRPASPGEDIPPNDLSIPAPSPAAGRAASERVTGVDGKTYPVAVARQQNKPPLPPRFEKATWDLEKEVHRLQKLRQEDRWDANRESISASCFAQLKWAADAIDELLNDLHAPGGWA